MPFATRTSLFCLLALTSLAQAAPNAAKLPSGFLERMRSASGRPYRAHIFSIWSINRNGHPLVIEDHVQGLREIIRTCHANLCRGDYFDGKRRFSLDYNDVPIPTDVAPRPRRRAEHLALSLAFLGRNFSAQGGAIENLGVRVSRGEPERVLEIRSPNTQPFTVDVSARTALVHTIHVGHEWIALSEYRRVGDFELPFLERRSSGIFRAYETRISSSVPFQEPQALFLPSGTSAPVPLLQSRFALPVIRCSVDAQPAKCLLDTGDSSLAMSLRFAQRIQAQTLGVARASGFGAYATEIIRAGPIRVSTMTAREADFLVLPDLDPLGIDVVIGSDLFATAPFTIDGHHRTVTFDSPALPTAPIFPLDFFGRLVAIHAQIGGVPLHLIVDSGDAAAINLTQRSSAAAPGLFAPLETRHATGIGGTSSSFLGAARDVRIGRFAFGAFALSLTPGMIDALDGHLGAGFLLDICVRIDEPRAQVQAQPSDCRGRLDTFRCADSARGKCSCVKGAREHIQGNLRPCVKNVPQGTMLYGR